MNPNDYVDDQPQPHQVDNPLETMRPGEGVVCIIKRHPIGLFGIYVAAAVVLIAALAGAVLAPSLLTFATSQTKLGVVLGALLVAAGTLLYVYAATLIYTANRWIVTTDSITQVSQTGLFNTQSSQLSLSDLEDITVDQHGIFQTLFNYGTLKAETAGEHSRFTFTYCPMPNACGRRVLDAREKLPANRTE